MIISCRQAEYVVLVGNMAHMPGTFLMELVWTNISVIYCWVANCPTTHWLKTKTIWLSLTILTELIGVVLLLHVSWSTGAVTIRPCLGWKGPRWCIHMPALEGVWDSELSWDAYSAPPLSFWSWSFSFSTWCHHKVSPCDLSNKVAGLLMC